VKSLLSCRGRGFRRTFARLAVGAAVVMIWTFGAAAQEAAAEAPDEEAPAQEAAAEAPDEEAPAQEAVVEAPAEAPPGQETAAEAPAEAPPAEETAAAEASPEEAPAQETAEEAPDEESPAQETAVEAPAEAPPAEEAAAAAESPPDFAAFRELLDGGAAEVALEEGAEIVAQLEKRSGVPEGLGGYRETLDALKQVRAAVLGKFGLLVSGAETGKMSAFAYVKPSPSELYDMVSSKLFVSRPDGRGLDEETAGFLEAYSAAYADASDGKVLENYGQLTDLEPGEDCASKARQFLTAYFLGAHEGDDLSAALRRVCEEVAGGALPVFLVEDSVEMGLYGAANTTVKALDAVEWASWPGGERERLCRLVAESAREEHNFDHAVEAYRSAVEGAGKEEGERLQYALIKLHAEHAKNPAAEDYRQREEERKNAYRQAALACGRYLELFPEGENRKSVLYSSAFYNYLAGSYEEAAEGAAAFRSEYPDSSAIPNVMLVEGLAAAGLGKTEEAIAVLEKVLEEHRETEAAGNAAYAAGTLHLSLQEYEKARDMFQTVVDYYPENDHVSDAKQKLEKLQEL